MNFNIEMRGFEELKRNLDDMRRAFATLDGEIATVRFDPSDPGSVESAITEANLAIEQRVGPYERNPTVRGVVDEAKQRYADGIRERARKNLAEVPIVSTEESEVGDMSEGSSERDKQRYVVLKYYFDFNEEHAGQEQWSMHVTPDLEKGETPLSHDDIVRAIYYLRDKGLLRITSSAGVREAYVRAQITATGVDAIERPNEHRAILSSRIINFINHGSMNVAHGSQQVVGGSNFGILAQGNAVASNRVTSSFPADELRAAFRDHPDALTAVDSLESELRAENPRNSVIWASIEKINHAAVAVEVGHLFYGWFHDPTVQAFLAMLTQHR